MGPLVGLKPSPGFRWERPVVALSILHHKLSDRFVVSIREGPSHQVQI
jgi:hypothetical protein